MNKSMEVLQSQKRIVILTRPAITLRVATDVFDPLKMPPHWQQGSGMGASTKQANYHISKIHAGTVACQIADHLQNQNRTARTKVEETAPPVVYPVQSDRRESLPLLSQQAHGSSSNSIQRSVANESQVSPVLTPCGPVPRPSLAKQLPAKRRKKRQMSQRQMQQQHKQRMLQESRLNLMCQTLQQSGRSVRPGSLTSDSSNASDNSMALGQSQLPAWLPQDLPFVLDVSNTEGILWDVENLPFQSLERELSKGQTGSQDANAMYHTTPEHVSPNRTYSGSGFTKEANCVGSGGTDTPLPWSAPLQLEAASSMDGLAGSTTSAISTEVVDPQVMSTEGADWFLFDDGGNSCAEAAEDVRGDGHHWAPCSAASPESAPAPASAPWLPWSTPANFRATSAQLPPSCPPRGAIIITGDDGSSGGGGWADWSHSSMQSTSVTEEGDSEERSRDLSGKSRAAGVPTVSFGATISTGFVATGGPWGRKGCGGDTVRPGSGFASPLATARTSSTLCSGGFDTSVTSWKSSPLHSAYPYGNEPALDTSSPLCVSSLNTSAGPPWSSSSLIHTASEGGSTKTTNWSFSGSHPGVSRSQCTVQKQHSAHLSNVQLVSLVPQRSIVLQVARGNPAASTPC